MPVTGGSIVVRSYRPHNVTGAAPPMRWSHGGGWVTGSIDELVCDATARHRAVAVGCVVFAIEYRLAPEYPFPTAVHEVIASMRWIRTESDRLGVDPANVSLGGNSAGANLAAAAALAAPDLELRHLLLEVPALDLTTATLRAELAAGEYFETVDMIEQALALYFAEPTAAADPLASPLLAPDLGAMPPTTVVVAELDPLRREGHLFAERLREAGVPVDYTCYPGAMHGSPISTGCGQRRAAGTTTRSPSGATSTASSCLTERTRSLPMTHVDDDIPGKVTIYDVATRAGVSIATVSHTLNRPHKVSAATRDRVLQIIDELQFVPKATAPASPARVLAASACWRRSPRTRHTAPACSVFSKSAQPTPSTSSCSTTPRSLTLLHRCSARCPQRAVSTG